MDSKLIILHFILARKKWIYCLNVTWEYLQLCRPRKSIIIDLFSIFLNAGIARINMASKTSL